MKKENIAENLIRIRKEKGLAAKSVAKMLDVDDKTYVSWEMGVEIPTAEDIMKISEVYNIDYTELFEDAKTRPNTNVDKNTNRTETQSTNLVTFQKWGAITNIVLIVALLLSFIIPAFYVYIPYFGGGTFSYYNLLRGDGTTIALMVFLMVIPILFFIDYIVKLSYSSTRTNAYGKISNILELVLTIVFIGCYIGINVYVSASNLGAGFYISLIIVIAFVVFSLLTTIMNLSKKGGKKNKKD